MTGTDRAGPGREAATWPARTGGTGARTLTWYADDPGTRTRQVVGDAAVALWCLMSTWLAMTVSSGLRRLQEPTERLQDVGDLLGKGPGPLGDAGEKLSAAGIKAHDGIGIAAIALGVVVAVVLMGWVAARWLPRRVRHARDTAAVLHLNRDVDALALRAATTLPLHRLARLGPDPVARWWRGEPGTAEQLATLQRHVFGVRPPTDPPQPMAPIPSQAWPPDDDERYRPPRPAPTPPADTDAPPPR